MTTGPAAAPAARGDRRRSGGSWPPILTSDYSGRRGDELQGVLKEQVRNAIGGFATPDVIHIAPGLLVGSAEPSAPAARGRHNTWCKSFVIDTRPIAAAQSSM